MADLFFFPDDLVYTGWLKGNLHSSLPFLPVANILMWFMAMSLSDRGNFCSIIDFPKFDPGVKGGGELP